MKLNEILNGVTGIFMKREKGIMDMPREMVV